MTSNGIFRGATRTTWLLYDPHVTSLQRHGGSVPVEPGTGRMGQNGTAITICTDVERWMLGRKLWGCVQQKKRAILLKKGIISMMDRFKREMLFW